MTRWLFVLLTLLVGCSSEPLATSRGAGDSGSGSSGSSGSTGGGGSSGSSGGGSVDGGAGVSGNAGNPRSDAGPGAPETSPEVLQACSAFVATFCAKVQSCSPFALGVVYGDVTTCKQRLMLSCIPNSIAPGTSAVPAKTTGCEQSIAALACPKFLANDLGAACAIDPGTVAQGGACGDDAQCATTFCARAPDAACGICQPPTKVGDPCVQGSCSTGTVCPAGQSKCITPVAGQVNATCSALEECDLANAVGCNTGSKKCIALTMAPSQGACGADSIVPTSYAVCSAGGTCSAAIFGKCSLAAADGAACSTSDTGAHCMTPARCVAGKCIVVDPILCH
jgi:hypothetical protein